MKNIKWTPFMTNKFSHGLKMMLEPLTSSFGIPVNLVHAMRKAGKRGEKATLYPTDLRKVKVIFETIHDITGNLFVVEVFDGNIEMAMNRLALCVKQEDNILENQYACA